MDEVLQFKGKDGQIFIFLIFYFLFLYKIA